MAEDHIYDEIITICAILGSPQVLNAYVRNGPSDYEDEPNYNLARIQTAALLFADLNKKFANIDFDSKNELFGFLAQMSILAHEIHDNTNIIKNALEEIKLEIHSMRSNVRQLQM